MSCKTVHQCALFWKNKASLVRLERRASALQVLGHRFDFHPGRTSTHISLYVDSSYCSSYEICVIITKRYLRVVLVLRIFTQNEISFSMFEKEHFATLPRRYGSHELCRQFDQPFCQQCERAMFQNSLSRSGVPSADLTSHCQ